MSVLSNIANRLQTDIAENSRAIIDVNFSQKLTEDRFNEKSFSRQAMEERRAREEDMAFRAQQAQEQRSWAAALDFGNKLYDTALDSGDRKAWNAFAEYATNPNLPPELASYFVNMNAAQGTKTMEQMKFEHQKYVDYSKLDIEEQQFMHDMIMDYENAELQGRTLDVREAELAERVRQFTEQEKRLFLQFGLEERKQAYKEMETLKAEGITNSMKWKLVGMIDTVKGMSPEEKQAFKDRLNGVDLDQHQLDQVWDELMTRHRVATEEQGKNARAKLQANSQRDPSITDPGNKEIDLVLGHLQNNEQFQALPEDQQNAMANWGSFHVNYLSRKLGKNQVEVAKQAADAAMRGLSKDGDFFEVMKESVFQPLKAEGKPPPGIPDSYVQQVLDANPGATREQVIERIWADYEEKVDY